MKEDVSVGVFQFATNAVGRISSVFEQLLFLFITNALVRGAGIPVLDLTPSPREGEVISLTRPHLPEEVREAARKAGVGYCLWGSLEFGPPGSPWIREVMVEVNLTHRDEGAAVSSRAFPFDGLRAEARSSHLAVDIPALEDLVEEIMGFVAAALGVREVDPARIGEGLSLSDRALVYFIYALRMATDRHSKKRLYLKALAADPRFALAYVNLAQLLIGEGSHGEAARLLLKARARLKGNPLEPDVLNLLGVALLHLGMYRDAVNVWRRALSLKRDNLEALCNLASAYLVKERWSDAEELYREALRIDDRYPLAWLCLGRLMVRKGDFAEAERALNRYIQLCPGDPWAYFLLGSSLASQNRRGEAEFFLGKAVQLDPHGQAGASARQELQRLREGNG
jgi:Flp pilus assembly protein TadD